MRVAMWTGSMFAVLIALVAGRPLCAAEGSTADGSRLAYLDENDPYYVSRSFPKLTTPQWVGEDGVEAVVVLAIDDMRGHERWEAYLRPILERLKRIDGRAAVSIMTCQIDPEQPHLQQWLREGLSLETHTFDHPCPLLHGGDLANARQTFDRCVDLLHAVPGNRPVAFRMPCCDSLNTPSPRFFAEIFNQTTPQGHFLSIDTSVFNLLTPNDPELPRETVLDAAGHERFRKYLPTDRTFVNTIEDYPYPYVIGRLCWEFPCVVPSDWEAQQLQQPANPQTVADMQAALDAVVARQGCFNLVFHPYEWIRNDQVVSLIDHAVAKHGRRVKFLTFREAQERLNRCLLAGQPLRAPDGGDNGVRLIDLNADGYLDVVIGNDQFRQTRIWSPPERDWVTAEFPISLVTHDSASGRSDAGARFGVVRAGQAGLLIRSEQTSGAWHFDSGENRWIADDALLDGLEIDGQPVLTRLQGRDAGVRLRDLDGDGRSECLVGNPRQRAAFRWDEKAGAWRSLPFALPAGTALVDAQGRDAGLRFVDVDEDGHDDVLFSNESAYSLHLYRSLDEGWSREALAGIRQAQAEASGAPAEAAPPLDIPPITLAGGNGGAWFHSRHMWVQNETTDRLPDHVDRRSFADLLRNVEPEAKSPRAALHSLVPRPGFQIEFVAAEPLVMDPIAFAWGPDGKLWVVEMSDYPLGTDGQGQFGGRVRYLEDTNGDGRYDSSTLFLDGLGYPSGVMPWRKGVLITCAPEILYAEDTDGDGHADVRRTLFKGFSEGNQQHRVNGLRWGLDNWVYCANGDSGGEITSVQTGESVPIGGRDFRVRPDQGLIDAQTGQTQFMRERDDWGHWFGSNNSNPMYHFVLDDHYLRRNPHLSPPDPRVQVSVAPGAAPVFPLSRTLARFNDLNAADRFTSACSAIIYRDDLFGPQFAGNSFVSEPVHNLVHREVVSSRGVTFTSRRADDEQRSEFLASTDNWFRPTMLRTGPDGALWIADMYRQVIEHPEWIPADWQQRLDLRAGHDQGRIYRVYPVGKQPRPIPRLDRLDSPGLVAALDSPSGWQRDMAQQLLVERQDPAAVGPLEALMADRGKPPLARLHALCTLDGLNALTAAAVTVALDDPHPGVRRHAVRLSEPLLDKSTELARRVAELAGDADPHVRMQLAYSLGEWHSPEAGCVLGRLAIAGAQDPYTMAAVMSSLAGHNLAAAVEAVLSETRETGPPASMMNDLLSLVVMFDSREALSQALESVARPANQQYASWQIEAVRGVLDGLSRRGLTLAELRAQADGPLKLALEQTARMFDYARDVVANDQVSPEERKLAMGLLGRGSDERQADIAALGALLVPQTPGELQSAAVAALAQINDMQVPPLLLDGWQAYGPELRAQVLDALVARDSWLTALVDKLRDGRVLAAEIDAARRRQLLEHPDENIRRASEALLSGAIDRDRQAVVASYRPALELRGDAERGAAVFKKSCASCHRLGDVGHAVGPDLAALTDRSAESLLVALFDPNRAVEAKYLSYIAITVDGLTHTGMLAAETGSSITLLATEGKEIPLVRSDLEALAGSSKSLMPEGLEKDLDQQQVADLIRYLGGVRPPRKVFAGNHPMLVRPEALRGELWLLAEQAEVYGSTLVFEHNYRNLGYWQTADDHACWSLHIERPGQYSVWLDYACADETAGNRFVLELAGHRLDGQITGTGNWDTYRQVQLGQLELKAGPQQLVIRPDERLSGFLMDLKAVRLRPAEE